MPEEELFTYIEYLKTYPGECEAPWSERLQGLTYGDGFWFLTQSGKRVLLPPSLGGTPSPLSDRPPRALVVPASIWKIPVGHDLSEPLARELSPSDALGALDDHVGIRARLPTELAAYLHAGDPCYYRDHLFVPLEDHYEAPKLPPCIAVFTKDLQFLSSAELPAAPRRFPRPQEAAKQQKLAGWCAINPRDQLLYTSNMRIQESREDGGPIRRYAIDFGSLESGDFLEFVDFFPLADEVGQDPYFGWMQGGAFLEDGSLLLTVGTRLDAFDSSGNRWESRRALSAGTDFLGYFDSRLGYELEGLAVLDCDDSRGPGLVGQIHVIELNNDVFDDNFSLKHYAVKSTPYVLNRRSGEIHKAGCYCVAKMNFRNRVPWIGTVASGVAKGHDGCFHCLPEYSKR